MRLSEGAKKNARAFDIGVVEPTRLHPRSSNPASSLGVRPAVTFRAEIQGDKAAERGRPKRTDQTVKPDER